jgi:hypothetical protein
MQTLSPEGRQQVQDLANRYGVSLDAAMTLLQALVAGNGTMAQFNHPELGGGGQWLAGGMIMLGDMFNQGLKAKVDGLCNELAALLARQPPPPPASFQYQGGGGQMPPQGGGQMPQQGGGYAAPVSGEPIGGHVSLFVPGAEGGGHWWPAELGIPATSGAQNNLRYAYFPASRRLAVDLDGQVTVYDTLDHQIGGVSQQQGGGGASLTFTSQYGVVSVVSLPVVSGSGGGNAPFNPPPAPPVSTAETGDMFAMLERLAELRQRGILTDDEFNRKKAELLSRL